MLKGSCKVQFCSLCISVTLTSSQSDQIQIIDFVVYATDETGQIHGSWSGLDVMFGTGVPVCNLGSAFQAIVELAIDAGMEYQYKWTPNDSTASDFYFRYVRERQCSRYLNVNRLMLVFHKAFS